MHLKTYIIPNSWHLNYYSLQTTLHPPLYFYSPYPSPPLLFSFSFLSFSLPLPFSFIPFYFILSFPTGSRSTFGSTFPVPVCTVPSSMDKASRCNKVDAVRLYASYRLNLLLSFPVFFLSRPHSFLQLFLTFYSEIKKGLE